jgi:hypothetical protein
MSRQRKSRDESGRTNDETSVVVPTLDGLVDENGFDELEKVLRVEQSKNSHFARAYDDFLAIFWDVSTMKFKTPKPNLIRHEEGDNNFRFEANAKGRNFSVVLEQVIYSQTRISFSLYSVSL